MMATLAERLNVPLGPYNVVDLLKSRHGSRISLTLTSVLFKQGNEIAMEEAQLQIEHYWAGALRRAVIDGDVENGSLMAGQSVGMLKREEPVAEIIASLMSECEGALARR